jgi:predicted PurR-regulated permease PerM
MPARADQTTAAATPTLQAAGGAPTGIWIVAGLAILWTAYFVQPIAIPIAFALLLKFLLSPIVRAARRHGVPSGITALALVVGGLVAGGALVVAVAPAAAHWTEELPERLHQLEGKALALTEPVAAITEVTTKVGEKVDDLAAAANRAPDAEATVVRLERPTWLATALGTLQRLAVELFLMVAMLFLLLVGDGIVLAKMQAAGGPSAPSWLAALRSIEQRMSTYVRSMLFVHGSMGVLVALFGWAWGMPSPWLWGTLAAIGNAIPFVGPLVVSGVLAIVALTTFAATGIALVPPLVYLLLHAIETNLVTPCLLGRWLSLSPVAIFATLCTMGFLWGVPGLVLAVPILVVVRITSDYVPWMQALHVVLDGGVAGAPTIPLPPTLRAAPELPAAALPSPPRGVSP